MKVFDDNLALRGSFSRIHNTMGWTDGEVLTPHGIVSVYAQGDDKNEPFTRLDFVLDGRLYMRNFMGKRYTHRGIVTKANQFAAEIVAAKEPTE